jgi:hypothetical protein
MSVGGDLHRRRLLSCIFVETECGITVCREDFHQPEYWYEKVLEAERREVQYWKVRI